MEITDAVELLFIVDRFSARRLIPEHLPLIENLNEQCIEAFMFQNGAPPTEADALETFEKFPSGFRAEDKMPIGFFNEHDRLVGMFEILKGYRNPKEWYIGLALITPDERGKGLGTNAHSALADCARRVDVKRLLLAVLQDNLRARKFWLSLGYRILKEYPPRQIGKRTHAMTEFAFLL
jgi:RimJ/RimL family protein N-acetyltransferase